MTSGSKANSLPRIRCARLQYSLVYISESNPQFSQLRWHSLRDPRHPLAAAMFMLALPRRRRKDPKKALICCVRTFDHQFREPDDKKGNGKC